MVEWLWLWWLIGALVLAAVEMMTVDFTFLMLSAGALAAMVAALLHAPWWACIIVFGVVSVVMLATVRPLLLRLLKVKAEARPVSGAAALVGKPAEAVTSIDEHGGRAKIGGEVWTARIEGEGVVPPGAELVVTAIDGATSVVAPVTANPREV
ncbi:MAG: NfeD family protein [Bifidobacteriaceae bacterium]|jgi:membrane protein implicated in regulation of membrane protease activity|nr:NfeD family protein [Bifidobacteriaceae bacterium]